MNWSFINSFISIFCLWGVCATVEITPSMSASLNKLTFQISSWQNSERCGGVVITPNAKLTHSPQKFSPPVSKPALRNQQAYATSWTNVNKKSVCFKTQSVLSVMKVWCAVTMLGGEAHINDQQSNPPLQSIMINSLILTASWLQRWWGAVPDKLRFGEASLHLWDLYPWLWLLLQRGFLQWLQFIFSMGWGVIFTIGTWFKACWTVNMSHFTISTYSGQAYSHLAQLSVCAGQCSNLCFLGAAVKKSSWITRNNG